MPDVQSTLQVLVDVKNAATGASQIRDVGKAGQEAGAGAEKASGGFGGMAKNLAAAAGGAVVVKKGFDFMKGAVGDAQALAKATAGLQRTTGLDAKTASGWVSIAKSRGIESAALNKGFVKLAQNTDAVAHGNKAAAATFLQMGIDAQGFTQVAPDQRLNLIADSFQSMADPAAKAALAQKLFGKQGQALLPILNAGSAGLKDQMAVMQEHGLVMDKAGVQKGLEFAKTQRELKATSDGLKMTIGQALLPILAQAAQAFAMIVEPIAKLLQSSPILSTAVVVLATAIGGIVLATKAWAIAQGVLNSTLLANPVFLVIAAVVALGVAFVVAYQKVGWFRDAVDAAFGAVKSVVVDVFNWIKGNWPLLAGILLGPFGAVVAVIVTHFGEIKAAGKGAIDAIKTAFGGLASAVAGAVTTVINELMKIPNAAKSVADTVKNTMKDIGGGIGGVASDVGGFAGKFIPHAYGGTVGAGGELALVGERGPEVMQLPGGTRITPLAAGTVTPVDFGAFGGGELHVHLDVDGRELAHVVARQTSDQQAKR